MPTVTHPTATHIDASAVAQLDTDAQRAPVPAARIVREGGPTAIRFESRDDFAAWADYGLIHVDPNPYHTTVGHVEVHVPVTFGFPYAWNAVAIFPAQAPCPCEAEVVHQTGCPSDRYAHFGDVLTLDPDLTDGNDAAISHLLEAAAQIPVVVVDVPRGEKCADSGCWLQAEAESDFCRAHGVSRLVALAEANYPPAVLPQRIPGALLGDVPTLAEVAE